MSWLRRRLLRSLLSSTRQVSGDRGSNGGTDRLFPRAGQAKLTSSPARSEAGKRSESKDIARSLAAGSELGSSPGKACALSRVRIGPGSARLMRRRVIRAVSADHARATGFDGGLAGTIRTPERGGPGWRCGR